MQDLTSVPMRLDPAGTPGLATQGNCTKDGVGGHAALDSSERLPDQQLDGCSGQHQGVQNVLQRCRAIPTTWAAATTWAGVLLHRLLQLVLQRGKQAATMHICVAHVMQQQSCSSFVTLHMCCSGSCAAPQICMQPTPHSCSRPTLACKTSSPHSSIAQSEAHFSLGMAPFASS